MFSNRTKLLCSIFALSLLAGCAGTTEFVEISPEIYSVSGYSDMTDNGGSVRIDLVKKAQIFCEQKGKKLSLLESSHTDGNSYKSATATINFTCIEPNARQDSTAHYF